MSTASLLKSAPIVRVSLAESVYQALVEAILSGKLAGGTELTSLGVAAEFGVSRTPVHEAIRRLSLDGLVRLMPNRTALVVKFTAADVAEIYEMRALLEPAAAELAATRLKAGELAELRKAADALSAGIGVPGWSEWAINFDNQLHQQLAAGCGNSRLRMEISKYRQMVRALCRMSGTVANLLDALREHLAILDALDARDPARARLAMEKHIKARLGSVLVETARQVAGFAAGT